MIIIILIKKFKLLIYLNKMMFSLLLWFIFARKKNRICNFITKEQVEEEEKRKNHRSRPKCLINLQ